MKSSSRPTGQEMTSYHVDRARRGDRESLEWVVRRFTPLLLTNADYRLGKTLRELYDPEDIVNDVWVAALPRLPELPSRDGRYTPVFLKYLSKTLVYRINTLIEKHIRGKPRRARGRKTDDSRFSDPFDELEAGSTSLMSRLVRREVRDTVTEYLQRLEPRDRELIILRGIEQRPYKEISMLLGTDHKVLAVEYQRALRKLKNELPGSVFEDFTDS